MKGIYSQKQKIEPLRDVVIDFMQTNQKHNQTIWTEGKYNGNGTTRFNDV